MERLKNVFDEKKFCGMILKDILQTFLKTNHDLLVAKPDFSILGHESLKLIESYETNH